MKEKCKQDARIFFHLTFFCLTRRAERSWSEWQRKRVEWEHRIEEVVWWLGGVVWSDIQLPSTLTLVVAGWWSFPRVGLEVGHKNFQPLSLCFIIGAIFFTVHIQLKWLYDWHIVKYFVSDVLISPQCISMTTSPVCIGNHICSNWASACKVCVLTPDLQQISCLIGIPNWTLTLKNIHHDIFMYEVSIRLDTEDTWRVGMSPVVVLWLLVL